MKQLKKMSARDAISCDISKNLVKRGISVLAKDLELYNKDGLTDVSFPPEQFGSEKKGSCQKLMETSGEWKNPKVEYLDVSEKGALQGVFSSSHDNDINCYDNSEKSNVKIRKYPIHREKKTGKASWKNFKYLKAKGFYDQKNIVEAKRLGGITWEEILDNSDSSREKVNLVYRQKKSQIQRSSRVVDIYKEKSKAMYEPRKPLLRSKKKLEASDSKQNEILAQFDEIQIKYNIDLTRSKQSRTGRKGMREASIPKGTSKEPRRERKALRLKPSKQLKLERLISEDNEPNEKETANLSQYQSLNYSVDPLVKKPKKKSISQKKYKDYSEQIKKRVFQENKPLHIRNKSSATLIENKFVRIRPNKIKKISLNEQKSMHSEILSNLREQSYRYISKAKAKNYFQKISKKNFKMKKRKYNKTDTKKFPEGSDYEHGERKGKDLRIKEYDPYIKSVETESLSFVNNIEHIELKNEAFLQEGLSNKFASHQELFDNISNKGLGEKDNQASLKKQSENNSVFNESLEPKRKRREHSEPKELIKKSLQHKKQSVYKKSILNYTKPKNRKYRRKKDKTYLKDFSTLRAGESFKVKEKNVTQKVEKDYSRFNFGSKKKFVLRPDRKLCFQNQNSPNPGNVSRKDEIPLNSLQLNPVGEAEKKVPNPAKKNRHYIINDLLEKKGIDLNILSNKNAKKPSNKEILFRGRNEKKEPERQRKKSRSVKISLNNIRSSVVHLEKALAKEKNRLMNICNVTKNTKKHPTALKAKKLVKKKTANMNLKIKENNEVKSPKINKIMEASHFEEISKKVKPNPEKKKKKTGKLSTKNLLNKFNKMSYFDYKKNQKGRYGERQGKKNKKNLNLEEKLNIEEENDNETFPEKPRKLHLYER